ncbi:MAG: sulfatase-like hydrolase/transferase [Deltaproteobacteria bacterium]|nr:sulfatase-like hydrolase/transferase [Deltaproteobacteria bacterium]
MTEGASAPPLHPSLRRAVCLLGVFAVAKGALVVLRALDGGGSSLASGWTLPALLNQDLWTALLVGLVDATLRLGARRSPNMVLAVDRLAWLFYGGAALYVAVNVAVARQLSTPLTYLLAGAAGTTLADSLRAYVTASNLAAVALVVGAAALLPRLVKRRPRSARLAFAAAVAFLALGALGPLAIRRVETLGLHRNALAAMLGSTLAQLTRLDSIGRVAAQQALSGEGRAVDLRHLVGAVKRRHVIWVVLESHGASYLRLYGAKEDPTPNLSRLGQQALVLDGLHAVYPESIKGLFSTLCAAYPAPHTSADQYAAKRLHCDAFPLELQRAGYRTALFHAGRFAYLGMEHVVQGRGFATLADAAQIPSRFSSSFGVDEASVVERMLAFVDRLRPGERFFLMYLPIAGHHPYEAPGGGPAPFGTATDRARYLNDLHRGDLALGTFVEGLRRRGLLEQTLWVIHGDHGEAFLQHPGNVAHTLAIYQENVHVPGLIAAPGLFTRPVRLPQIGSTADLAPTLLELLGRPVPASYQGRSLLQPRAGLAPLFTDHGVLQLGLRHGPWKAIFEPESRRTRLYHLPTDPLEERSRTAEEAERETRYRDYLVGWAGAQRDWVLRGGKR